MYNPITGQPHYERISLTSFCLFSLPSVLLWNNVLDEKKKKKSSYMFSASTSDTWFRRSLSSDMLSLVPPRDTEAGVVYLITLNLQNIWAWTAWWFGTFRHWSGISQVTVAFSSMTISYIYKQQEWWGFERKFHMLFSTAKLPNHSAYSQLS